MGVKVTSKDNTDEVLRRMGKAFERGLKACGMTAEAYAKDTLTGQVYSVDESKIDYVLTGRLRNSVTYAIGGKPAAISSYKTDKPGYKGGSYSGNAPEEDKPYVAIGTNVKYAIGGKSANISSYKADKPGYKGGSYSGKAPEEDKPYVAVGTNVKYAIGIEEGTHRKKGAVHFLLKAASEHQEEYEKLIKESMENA